jgi:branched-chain amino acid transport system substrate-binding protein
MVGITVPLTGPYSADGKDEQLGYELAISEINTGSKIAKAWGVKGKGVLGKQIRYQAERRRAGADAIHQA